MRRIALTIVALAILVPSLAIARSSYLCEIDRQIRETCCCPKKQVKQPSPVSTIRANCCKIVKPPATVPPVDETRGARAEAPPIAIALAPVPVIPVFTVRPSIVLRAQPPPDSEPLFARHCSFLL